MKTWLIIGTFFTAARIGLYLSSPGIRTRLFALIKRLKPRWLIVPGLSMIVLTAVLLWPIGLLDLYTMIVKPVWYRRRLIRQLSK